MPALESRLHYRPPMRPIILAATALALALLTLPSRADACSIADDRAEPPEVERAYDASKALAAPVPIDVVITHNEDNGPSCAGASSCGDIHGLSLELDLAPGTSLIRIDIQGRETIYAHNWGTGGRAYMFLPGFADDDMLVMDIQALDADGFPSAAVEVTAYSDDYNEGGCRAATDRGQVSALLVLLVGLMLTRRRRRA